MSSFLTGQKGSEKAAANSEARGTAKGACGPLWKPRSSDGVARDGLRFSQGKGSLLQYPFYLPVRLIRAPVLKPRPRSQAGQPAGCLVPIWQTSSFRSVRRGRMYAARGCLRRCPAPGSCTRYRVFVGEAYRPCRISIDTDGTVCVPTRGVPGSLPVSLVL